MSGAGERERLGDDGRRAMLALLRDPPFQVFQGRARLDQPVDLLARRIGRLGDAVNVSANQAIVSASIGSFLASRPAALAKQRTSRIDDQNPRSRPRAAQ